MAGRIGLAAGLAATVVWSYVLLGRTADWFPALRPFVAVAGTLGVVAILALPLLRAVPKLAIGLVAVLGFGAALAAPLFSTVATAATPHNGAIPSVTPSRRRAASADPAEASPAAGATCRGRFAGGAFPGGARHRCSAAASPARGTGTGGFPGGFPGGAAPSFGGGGPAVPSAVGGPGGILGSSQSNAALGQAAAGRTPGTTPGPPPR